MDNERRKRKANMKDVAQLAGVSITTVSRFLNGNFKKMSSETADKIKNAIEKLNYIPNAAARQMVTNSSNLIAVIVSNIDDYFSTELFKGASSILEANGYMAVLFDSNTNPDREREIIKTTSTYNFDGLIFQPNLNDVSHIFTEIAVDTPTVIVDRNLDTSMWPQVLTDNFASAQKATQIFKNEGYSRVIILSSPVDSTSTRRDRFLGIKSVISNVEIIEIPDDSYNKKKVYQHLKNLLADSTDRTLIFSLKERWLLEFVPMLIFDGLIDNDRIAITGFADTNTARAISPNSKFITQSPFLMGSVSAEMLLKQLHNEPIETQKFVVPAKFL
ncbi:transcriptional regulator, LacI family [Weissella bombi]|uniref:Transcriptional regulator, LacI family n=1 Tax=Weissella bombi TaxID=1505725 RepID=A0A1C4A860_9LACO|nr:LacI family DNA-binding transcriptional regulator [Weissella bombi]SCB90755.1 transcriptional regulator, LacI family [Weissella bombi]